MSQNIPFLILISGKQGSGKSTLANGLQNALMKAGYTVQCMKFADLIYEMHDAVRRVAMSHGLSMPKKDGPLLQLLGTEWGREQFGDDVWVDDLYYRILDKDSSGYDYVLVDDCRFQNELELLKSLSGISIRLDLDRDIRKQRCPAWRENDSHPSETQLDDAAFTARFNVENLNQDQVVEAVVALIPLVEKDKEPTRFHAVSTSRMPDGSEVTWADPMPLDLPSWVH